ncbi:hypothetical protein B7P34_11755 [Streptosporangium nondiastaticum]|uniref:Uncharacterized protein n=2 Tax=Actinomycetes TaxID=1760 RepID=A0A9X7JRL7_9ACTN|nr:hypothetical protein [Streptosporangium nondiastaticum]PSJ28535.1 hypothetical protein B7P34_11755 [Streptosporangium nondiastaticum]
MTYRIGAFVVDTREGKIAQVIGAAGSRVTLRRPGGGLEWEAPFASLRLATREDREAAGLWPAMRRTYGCVDCGQLRDAYNEAAAGGDPYATGEALVLLRRHWRMVHMGGA